MNTNYGPRNNYVESSLALAPPSNPLPHIPKKPISPSADQTQLIWAYGVFMVAWSVLESVIQAAIHKELGTSAVKTVIVTGKLQFNPRVQLLIGLLKLHGEKYAEAIKILNKTEAFAKRNALVHGLIIVGVPHELSFVKYDGGGTSRLRFSGTELHKHALALNQRTGTLQQLLSITDADTQAICNATLELGKN